MLSRVKKLAASSLFVERNGSLSQELALTPGADGRQLPERLQPTGSATTICGYCATGCALSVHLRDDGAVNIRPAVDYSVNRGMACPKGWGALAPLSAADRGQRPISRGWRGRPQQVNWDIALREMCARFRDIAERHGPEANAFLSTGQIPTEEMALLGAVAKFGMGMVHGDGNTRQCMATAATAYKEAFGFDAPPYTYADFDESDVIVLVGSNLCIAHPIMWERVAHNRHGATVIVIDPRRTETAMAADVICRSHPSPISSCSTQSPTFSFATAGSTRSSSQHTAAAMTSWRDMSQTTPRPKPPPLPAWTSHRSTTSHGPLLPALASRSGGPWVSIRAMKASVSRRASSTSPC
jgi:assimilatory nitrate reductase catalytic subunit